MAKARVVSFALTGGAPDVWPVATVTATSEALRRAGLAPADVDRFEVHESSAAAVLAWLAGTGVPPERVNPEGGALATTAPLGACGAGLFVGAVAGLASGDGQLALVCIAAVKEGWPRPAFSSEPDRPQVWTRLGSVTLL